MKLHLIDILVFFSYVISLIILSWWVSRDRNTATKDTKDYFLAGSSLPWWAIGASLIAANISAEQIIGMSGSGYLIGLAIASYEWMAAIALLVVGKYFLPIFLEKKIYTMPQFLELRYDSRVRATLAVFWIGVYIFVNLTAVLWLGALAINTIAGVDLFYGMIFLGLFAVTYSLYGGLKAVALTDILQVTLLIIGGLFLTYTSFDLIGNGKGFFHGVTTLITDIPHKFEMILDSSNPYYKDLPGISVLFGGLWIMNLSYWGFNQYIIQRALAAKNLEEAQRGITFAAFLKVLMPIIVVLPGIAAIKLQPDLSHADQAYPMLMNLMPTGLKGIIFAALVAAIVSSVASMMNSVSTIFTMDLYKHRYPEKSQKHYVAVGRVVSLTSLVIAMLLAKPLLGNFDQAFQYIQEFTGFFTPGIVVLFLVGMFWKYSTPRAGLLAAIGSAVLSLLLKILLPEIPFIDRVFIVFIACLFIALFAGRLETNPAYSEPLNLSSIEFKTSRVFNICSGSILLLISAIYIVFW